MSDRARRPPYFPRPSTTADRSPDSLADSASNATQAATRCFGATREKIVRTTTPSCTPGTVPDSRRPPPSSTVTSLDSEGFSCSGAAAVTRDSTSPAIRWNT